MSRSYLSKIIFEMHARLDKIIENNNYDLMSSEVQRYSKKMDRVLLHYLNLNSSSNAFYTVPLPDIDLDKEAI